MITICILLFALLAIAVIVLALAGIIAVAWPVLVILALGLIIDIVTFKLIFKKKK